MEILTFNLKIIVLILTVGFVYASFLGYLAFRLKLSPLLGYLLAGYFIGPFSPGFVADIKISEQLAEIGVILMMFGVGLHFKWQDLMHTKNIAIPGAIFQTTIATLAGIALIHSIGWSLEAGIVFGFAVGVASTVVLVRVLSDNKLLNTPQGHVSVGWLIVEDIITVIMLLLIPIIASSSDGVKITYAEFGLAVGWAILKFILLILIMFTIGRKVVTYISEKLPTRTRMNYLL